MTPISIVSEPIPEEGGHIEGASPLKGVLGLSELLVRETVQNSWDARDPLRGDAPVEYRIDGVLLQGERLAALRRLMPFRAQHDPRSLDGFDDDPSRDAPELYLGPAAKQLEVLVVSDRHTVGLCGRERGGRAWQSPRRLGEDWPGAAQRFANFIRNTGRAGRNIGKGEGGSYGVGKTVLWRASRCGTILVHTRTTDEVGDPVDRVIGVVHGSSFDDRELQYTGRHFIGVRPDAEDNYVAPLTGEEARRVVADLGLPSYGDGFGTSVVVVAPRYDDDLLMAMKRLRDAARWHVWPKFATEIRPGSPQPDMRVTITHGGRELPIPDPDSDPELQPYVEALRDALHMQSEPAVDGSPPLDHEAAFAKIDKHLGWLRIREALGEDAWPTTHPASREGDAAVVSVDSPHGRVALIRRNPLLLVRYETLPRTPTQRTYAGVFLSADDADVERALTISEPQAHNDWYSRASGLTKEDAALVRYTLRDITKGIDRFKRAFLPEIRTRPAHELSRLIGGDIGAGGGHGGPTKPKVSPPKVPGATKPSAALFALDPDRDGDGRTVHRVNVSLKLVEDGSVVRLSPRASGRDSAGAIAVTDLVTLSWTPVPGADAEVDGDVLTTRVEDSSRPVAQLAITVVGDLRLRPTVAVEVLHG